MAIEQIESAFAPSVLVDAPPDASARTTSAPAGGRPGHGKRADIQGLRAVSVVLVVLNHLSGWPRGGFIGVDVFFVISGYLITGLLVRDLGPAAEHRNAAHALGRFYWRRITRLLPASLVVTVGSLIGAHLLFGASRFQETLHDGYWATGFLANVHFANVGTDYFAAGRPVSPLQHYWSLSVEEQFYVVWPVALLLASVLLVRLLGARRPTAPARWLVALPVLVTAGSLVWALHQADVSRTAAYFSTPARAWELGLGAVVACAQHHLRVRTAVARAMSLLGLTVVVASAFLVQQSSGLPAPGALLPCLGAALCLGAMAANGDGARNPLLTNRLSVHLGDISYSIYLVHFPVIILLSTRMRAHSPGLYFTAALLTLGIATLLNVAVERPFMTLGRRRRDTRRRSPRTSLRRSAGSLATGVTLALLGLAAMSVASATTASSALQRYDAVQSALRTGPVSTTAGPAQAALTRSIRAALAARTWPTLTPSFDEENRRQPVPAGLEECGILPLKSAAQCTFGPRNAPHTAYLVGDSEAMAYAAAYRSMLTRLPGWNLRVAAVYGCEFDSVVLANTDPSVVAGCAQHNAATLRDIAVVKPDLLLVTNTYTNRQARTGDLLSETQWRTALGDELQKVPTATRIAIVEPAPLARDPFQCYRPGSTPIDCVASVSSEHLGRAASEQLLARQRGWTFVDTLPWFCDATTGYCPAFAAGAPIRHDALHLAYGYDAVLAPTVLETLRASRVLR